MHEQRERNSLIYDYKVRSLKQNYLNFKLFVCRINECMFAFLCAGMIESYDKYTYVHAETWWIKCTEISHFFALNNSLRIMNQASLQKNMLLPLCIFFTLTKQKSVLQTLEGSKKQSQSDYCYSKYIFCFKVWKVLNDFLHQNWRTF